MSEPREVMTAKQLAQYLGLAYGTLRNLLSKKEKSLPPYKNIGGYKRWYLPTVKAWFENNTGSDSHLRESTSAESGTVVS